ncbi:MAG: hypothetical protein CVU64_11545 [Deltaproteobacteria bacterium HGW-Deltaproteobacteria-21]|nr:MAG: hypothetical protein CVU64_11545 [Deltaproteobacteria bacterium HGW-Deltaproteobacteria-21]
MRSIVKPLTFLLAYLAFLLFSLPPITFASETDCKEFIETRSAKQLSKELGKPVRWVVGNYKINLFDRETGKKKGKVVGKLIPGCRAQVLKTGADDYQVKSPLDGSVGWINRKEVRHILLLDSKTFKPCR